MTQSMTITEILEPRLPPRGCMPFLFVKSGQDSDTMDPPMIFSYCKNLYIE